MIPTSDDRRGLEELDARLRILLPPDYQDSYEQVQPVSMGSAGLKYDTDGTVAWDEIWDNFCDLAMAGGPPHKGTLLEPADQAGIDAQPERHHEVVDEICRGMAMVTTLRTGESPVPGWCRMECDSEAMAGWLCRALVMENISSRVDGLWLDLPAAPAFRLDKEIKNVVTAVAKTFHYWDGHLPLTQQRAIAELFAVMAAESPLAEPASDNPGASVAAAMTAQIHRETGLGVSPRHYRGWLGLECANVSDAVWMMRALVGRNVLSRREGTVLFVPINPESDPGGGRVARALAGVHHLAMTRHAL
jgi:sirohydrochlorin cobaltochelatase